MDDAKRYNIIDLKSALFHIRKKRISIKRASYFFRIPLDTLKEMLDRDYVEEEAPKQKLEPTSSFTRELENSIVDYVLKMGTQICAARSEKERKLLAHDLTYQTLDLNFFKAPPGVKRLKVFVKRQKDNSPFYVFDVSSSDYSHFVNGEIVDIKQCFHVVKDKSPKKRCPRDVEIKLHNDPGLPTRYEEYILPDYTETVDSDLGVMHERFIYPYRERKGKRREDRTVKRVPTVKKELIEMKEQCLDEEQIGTVEPSMQIEFMESIVKKERIRMRKQILEEEQIGRVGTSASSVQNRFRKPIVREEVIQMRKQIPQEEQIERVEPRKPNIKIEFSEPILKEELHLEDWTRLEPIDEEFTHVLQNGDLEEFEDVLMREPEAQYEENVVEDFEIEEMYEPVKIEEADTNSRVKHCKYKSGKRRKRNVFSSQKRKKRKIAEHTENSTAILDS